MREPQLQEPAARTRGRTAENERREARQLRQRRRQRSRARVSDLVACEPRKPHCRSDPTIPPSTNDRVPPRRSTQRELPPDHRCASPNYRNPQRARGAVRLRTSVVRLGICGSAAASAAAPASPIWLSASRASLTAAPTLQGRRPHSYTAPSTRRELPPDHRCASPNYRNPQRARVAVLLRSSVVRLGICGSAAASEVAPASPILLSASRASLTAAPTLQSRRPHPTAHLHAEAHGASCHPTTDARAPTTGTRNAHAWPYC
jgi:hypothetical protein